MKYLYEFSVQPNLPFSREVFKLFESLNTRIQMDFTEEEFRRFRSVLNDQGFALVEIERVPYQEPESIL